MVLKKDVFIASCVLLLYFFACSQKEGRITLNPKNGTKTEVISRKDCDTSSLRTEAKILYMRDSYEEAILIYDKLISYDSTNGEFYYNRGYCLAQINRDFEAINDFLKSISFNYRLASCYKNLGLVYDAGLNDKQKAEEYFIKFLEIEPGDKVVRDLLRNLRKDEKEVDL